MAFLIDNGADSFIFQKFIMPLSSGTMRHIGFNFYFSLKYIMVSITVLFLATYFLSKYLSHKLIISSACLTLGALCTDLFYFKKMPFDSSYFFSSRYHFDYFNIIAWGICTMAVIYLGRLLRIKCTNRGEPLL